MLGWWHCTREEHLAPLVLLSIRRHLASYHLDHKLNQIQTGDERQVFNYSLNRTAFPFQLSQILGTQ